MTTETLTVEEQVATAYADCGPLNGWKRDYRKTAKPYSAPAYLKAMETRQLKFRASEPVSRAEAIRIMQIHVPSYNAFDPILLEVLPWSAQVTIAREASVCIYVSGKVDGVGKYAFEKSLSADEVTFRPETNETRIWWD